MKMYFVKSRKSVEEQDAKDRQEKSRRDRYQRSDSARLVMQMQAQQQLQSKIEESKLSRQVSGADPASFGLSVDSLSDFKPEELPDGAFYRPKKDLSNLQAASSAATSTADASSSNFTECTRRAEYIGTFPVSGNDKEARERQMETQLEQMRTARERRPVNIIISNTGVKVVLHENNNVFMEHSLKRIWYATCDPDYCQFSFLAREPKTSAETQYCHAFVTQTAQQAEELISVIGEAFKSADVEAKKPPTFHELIEQQVQQQQAKFRETEKEAQSALQQKLKEIATPTPFSERAQFRMEQRRKSEDVLMFAGQDKLLGRQQSDPAATKQSFSPGNRRSEIPTRQATSQSSPLKRNSVPPQAATSISVPLSSSVPLSVMAIKESLESKSSNSKFKGSPVTALKNEIDRRLSMTDAEDIQMSGLIEREFRKDQMKPFKQQTKLMSNRPLPLPPSHSRSPQLSRRQPSTRLPLQQSQPLQPQQQAHQAPQRHSLDDYHLPRSSSSQIPLSSNARGGAGNVVLRDSPKRRQPRPMSDIATSSGGVIGAGAAPGLSDQHRQSASNSFAASFNLPTHSEVGSNGTDNSLDQRNLERQSGIPQEGLRQSTGGDRVIGGGVGSLSKQLSQKSEAIRPSDSQRRHSQGNPGKSKLDHTPATRGSRSASVSGPDSGNPVAPRYQNDSPFQNEKSEHCPSGFESLMSLDRSHIHDEVLRSSSWYQAGLPREIALEILQQEEVGSFIVRDSSSHPGCFALSVRVPKFENASGISHYLILRTHTGVKLKGLDKEWSTLAALVTHHTVMRELLPCTLRPPRVKGHAAHLSSSPNRNIMVEGKDGDIVGSSKS